MLTKTISMYFKVFGKVAGRLDPLSLGVSFSSLEGILRTIHAETKVDWKEIFDGFVVSGTFDQLKTVRELLICHLEETKKHKSERTPKDGRRPLVRDMTTTRESMVSSKVSTGSTSLRTPSICQSEEMIDKASGRKYNNRSIPNESQVERNESHGNPHGLVENERMRVSENAKKLHQADITSDASNTRNDRKKLIEDEKESQSEGISRPTPVTPSSKKQFVFLENGTEKTSGGGHLKTGIDDNASPPSRVSAIGNTSGNGTRPEDQGEDQDQDQDQGDVKNLLTSVKMQEMPLESSKGKTDRPTQPNRKRPAGLPDKNVNCEDLQSSLQSNRSCDADKTTLIVPVLNEASDQENQSCSHLESSKSDQSLSKGLGEYTTDVNSLKYITSTGITVLLQIGDITSSDVDVLLSPANPTLSYKEGVPQLILERGGSVIKEECHNIAKAECPLQYGATFLTSCGNLPCRGVLHTVLPPWIRDDENQRAYKRQIHRHLTEGLVLASGYRHRSVALPPLGQDGNFIPLEVSVEVITRVIAKFSDKVGPMHTGINDIRIVCEDDATMNAFAKELSFFSFRGDEPYFKMTPSKNELGGEDVIPKYQRTGRSRPKCDEGVDSSIATEKSVEQIQKATSSPVKGSFPNTENAQILTCDPKIEAGASSQLKPQPDSAAILPVVNGEMKDASLNNSRQCHENTTTVISSSVTESTDNSEASVFEILEVTSTATVALVEEVAKRVTAQNNSGRKLVKEFNLKVDQENFEERNRKVAETSELLEKLSALKITKAVTPEIQQPKPSPFSTTKEQGKGIPGSETSHFQSSLKDTQNLDPFQSRAHETTDAHSLNSSLLRMDNDLFVTSPTVEALLSADLRLGVQGLHIEHERNGNIDKAEGQGKKSVLPFKQRESNSNEHLVSITTSNEKQMITERNSQEDINENLQSKMEPAAAGKGDKRKSTHDKRCDFKETDGKKEEIDPALVDNYFNGDKRKGNDDHHATNTNNMLYFFLVDE